MPEHRKTPPSETKSETRQTQILNLLSNVSLLLIMLVTEAFSEMVTKLSKELITALSTSIDAAQADHKNLDALQHQFPDKLRKELLDIKQDLARQFQQKRPELELLLGDKRFDEGIAIVEHSTLTLPKLTKDLDDATLLCYLTLLQANDPEITAMFQQLVEWMNNLPQPQKKD